MSRIMHKRQFLDCIGKSAAQIPGFCPLPMWFLLGSPRSVYKPPGLRQARLGLLRKTTPPTFIPSQRMVQVRVQLVNWILPILLSLFLVSTSCLLSLISPTETPTHIPFLDTPRKRPELATSDHEDQLASTAFSMHQPALIRWSGWWIIAAFLIYVKWYRLLSPTWTDWAGPVPQRRTRGRALASVGAAVHDSSLLSVQSQPTYHFPPIEKDDANHSGAANIGLNAHTRRRCPVVQAPPRWVEDLVPPHAPAKARRSAGSTCIERAKSIPMLRSLYGTPRIRSRYQSLLYRDEELPPRAPIGAQPAEVPTPPPTEKLYVFFVGVNQDVEDPEHDVDAFKKIFKQPSIKDPSVRFASVTGVSATRRHIKGWLIWLDLLAASDGSKVLAFLSGSGDVTNRMCLSEGAGHIAENDLCDWLSTARTRLGLSNLKPVTIIFDICREGTNPPRVSRSDVVNLIWSCSLGQRSHAIGFEPPVLPRSCFWLALLRACKDVNPTFSGFEATFRRGLGELGRFVVHNYTVWHAETGFCDFCKEEIGGRCAWPEPQVPLGVQTGWEDLYELALIIAKSYNDSARMIDAVYREQMELYKLWVDNHTSRATQHIRGAHQPVSQANVQYLPEILSVAG